MDRTATVGPLVPQKVAVASPCGPNSLGGSSEGSYRNIEFSYNSLDPAPTVVLRKNEEESRG